MPSTEHIYTLNPEIRNKMYDESLNPRDVKYEGHMKEEGYHEDKVTACNPCGSPAKANGAAWIGGAFVIFIILIFFFWLIMYSLKPAFVINPSTGQLDTTKLFFYSIIAALIFLVILWMIKLAMGR